jgi:hypothetical protein
MPINYKNEVYVSMIVEMTLTDPIRLSVFCLTEAIALTEIEYTNSL